MDIPERHPCGSPSQIRGLVSSIAHRASASDGLIPLRAADRRPPQCIDHNAGPTSHNVAAAHWSATPLSAPTEPRHRLRIFPDRNVTLRITRAGEGRYLIMDP